MSYWEEPPEEWEEEEYADEDGFLMWEEDGFDEYETAAERRRDLEERKLEKEDLL